MNSRDSSVHGENSTNNALMIDVNDTPATTDPEVKPHFSHPDLRVFPDSVRTAIEESTPTATTLPAPSKWDGYGWLGKFILFALSLRGAFGKLISLAFSMSCGINTAAALATLLSGGLFIGAAVVLCIMTTYANYRMTNNDVSNTFREGFLALFKKNPPKEGEEPQEATDVEGISKTDYLSLGRRIFVGVGMFLSMAFGVVFGALTFQSTIGLVATFGFLGAVSAALPPVGIVLGICTFVCLSVVMVKAFSQLAKTENLLGKIKDVFKDLVFRHPERDRNKSQLRFVCERVMAVTLVTVLALAVVGLNVIGQVFTLNNCAIGFGNILNTVNMASVGTIDILSKVIGIGFGLTAQIPFILKTSFHPIIRFFAPKEPAPALDHQQTSLLVKADTGALMTASTFSAVASGAIAMAGRSLMVLPVMAGIGAFLNTFLGSVVNALISGADSVKKPQKPKTPSSTANICSTLTMQPQLTDTKTEPLLKSYSQSHENSSISNAKSENSVSSTAATFRRGAFGGM